MKKSIVLVAVLLVAAGVIGVRYTFLPQEAPAATIPAASAPVPAGAAPASTTCPGNFAAVADTASPSVVLLLVERQEPAEGDLSRGQTDFWDGLSGRKPGRPGERYTVQGTGFFITPDGMLITDYHVILNSILVTVVGADGREYPDVKVLGSDMLSDLALIKVRAENAPALPLGDSDTLRVGDWVLAIGNPFGLENSVTAGICSGKRRQLGTTSFERFIQTDASINQGNSGGPLLNARGEVIGINASILSSGQSNLGIGFATPTVVARHVIDQLKTRGRVTRSGIGADFQDVTAGIAKRLRLPNMKGAVVSEVLAGSPAAGAGLKPYDVVLSIDGRTVENQLDLDSAIVWKSPGESIELGGIRDGAPFKTPVVLVPVRVTGDAAPAVKPAAGAARDIGITAGAIPADVARRLGLRPTDGILVTGVRESSEAAGQGMKEGMIISEINRRPAHSPDDLAQAWKSLSPGDQLMLLVRYPSNGRLHQSIMTVRVS